MSEIPFVKVAGTGNDFILLDRRRRPFPGSLSRFAQTWCNRRRGIGADGVLVALPSGRADARMRIFNSDGSEAEMCGNGLRCLVWYLHTQNGGKKNLSVDTRAGLMRAQIVGRDRVRIYLSRPKNLRLGLRLSHSRKKYQVHAVNSGVPHAVLLTSHLEKADLACLGPVIRHHKAFKPAGTNVNLMRIESPHRVAIRTFERGVEGETLACGTGAVASVLIGAALGRLTPPVQVKTAGGDVLTVGFGQSKQPWEGLYLEGPAQILFNGEIS
jgi:diaminopimelate epimerase